MLRSIKKHALAIPCTSLAWPNVSRAWTCRQPSRCSAGFATMQSCWMKPEPSDILSKYSTLWRSTTLPCRLRRRCTSTNFRLSPKRSPNRMRAWRRWASRSWRRNLPPRSEGLNSTLDHCSELFILHCLIGYHGREKIVLHCARVHFVVQSSFIRSISWNKSETKVISVRSLARDSKNKTNNIIIIFLSSNIHQSHKNPSKFRLSQLHPPWRPALLVLGSLIVNTRP